MDKEKYTEKEIEEFFRLAIRGTLPEDFDEWYLSNKFGSTIAHAAAMHNHLPKGFSDWGLSNNTGWSVAHEAAISGTLPNDFADWRLADKTGWSVAHQAAEYGNIPKDFGKDDPSLLDITTNSGVTVQRIIDRRKQHRRIPRS